MHHKIVRRNLEKAFYEHYFSKIACERGMKLEDFYKPKPDKENKSRAAYSVEQNYIKNISLSFEFKQEVLAYLDNGLIENEMRCLEEKLILLVNIWEKIIEKAECRNKATIEICNDIKTSQKGKQYFIPLTIFEIKEAIEKVKRRLEKNSGGISD